MQTFLPYPDFEQSAQVLDRRRLGNQRKENLQILNAILDPSYGWNNHPAVNMWRGHLGVFYEYHSFICQEWSNRGYIDNCLSKFSVILSVYPEYITQVSQPSWLGDLELHRSHRSNLLRKDWDHYSDLFERDLPMDLPYIWPVP